MLFSAFDRRGLEIVSHQAAQMVIIKSVHKPICNVWEDIQRSLDIMFLGVLAFSVRAIVYQGATRHFLILGVTNCR